MASPASDNVALLQALMGLPAMLSGKGNKQVTSGFTETSQKQVSSEAMAAMLKSMMEDEGGGLAKIASGQKTPGLYNSTSRTLMVNDLMARSAAEVAKASAPTTVTRTPSYTQTVAPKSNSTLGLLGLAGAALGTKTGKKLLGRGMDSIEEAMAGSADFSYMPQAAMSDAEMFGSGPSFSMATDAYDLPFASAASADLGGFSDADWSGYFEGGAEAAGSFIDEFSDSDWLDFFESEGASGAVEEFSDAEWSDFFELDW